MSPPPESTLPPPAPVSSSRGTEGLTVSRDHVVVSRFRLVAVEGPDKGKTFVSQGERTAIGTNESLDAMLSDRSVSRFHCEIVLDGADVLLRDLESRNGTQVNGVRVREAFLSPGAILSLGRTRLRFDVGDEKVSVALSPRDRFGTMVGSSPAMRRAFALLELAAASDATALLDGETGTGKEAAAESIHRESRRRDGPFVVVDCASIPPDLLESELLGHERGAFTGATSAREGSFEAAHGGTVFLDEIGELGLDLQPKLLRVLERREVKRVGGNKVMAVDVRVIAATNRDLRAEVNSKRFRADLYYRLAVLTVKLPPLRERLPDLPMLIDHIVHALGVASRPEAEITRSQAFIEAVRAHSWPGNVRELRNYVERCLAFHREMPIEAPAETTEPGDVDVSVALAAAREAVVHRFERRYLAKILELHGGNVTAAARAACVDRIHFHRLMRKHAVR